MVAGFGWPGSSSVAAPTENGKAARERLLAVGHVVLQMHGSLGASGRAGGIHPECHLVARGVGFRQIGREFLQPWCRGETVGHRVFACVAVHHDQRLQRRVLAGFRIESRRKLGFGNRDGSAGVRQIELQEVRRRQRIDQERHEARTHRAEEGRGIGRRVVEEHQDAVAALQAQRLEPMSPLRRLGAELRVGSRAAGAGERQPFAAAVRDIVEQNAAGVVAFRKRKSDLARAGIVPRDLIGNVVIHAWLPFFEASYRAMKAGDIARRRASSMRPERVI
jgi:hypothetical protein